MTKRTIEQIVRVPFTLWTEESLWRSVKAAAALEGKTLQDWVAGRVHQGILESTIPATPLYSAKNRPPVTHELKTDQLVFQAVVEGLKPWEIRIADRDYQVGDNLLLRETEHTGFQMANGAPLEYTGRYYEAQVTFIFQGPAYGLKEGWVIMTICEV